MSLHCKLSASGVLLGTLLFTRILPAQDPAADLVLIHGHILTVDANDSVSPRFLEYPELELSNNLAENSMRPVALGRKNWIHIGSPQAGPKVAAILSVVESCRRLILQVRDYLAAVLPGFADLPIRRVPALTPAAWRRIPMLWVGWRRLVGRGQ
jgi:hypothetical protein